MVRLAPDGLVHLRPAQDIPPELIEAARRYREAIKELLRLRLAEPLRVCEERL